MKNKILSLVLAALMVLSMVPFAALTASAANPVFASHEFLKASTAAFENPWTSTGNYVVKGMSFEKGEYDGEEVFSIVRDPEIADAYAYRASDDSTSTSLSYNMFHYDQLKDVDGNMISLYDAQYMTIEYYYEMAADRATFEGEEETCTEIVGKDMQVNFYNVFIDGTKTGKGIATKADTTIVANEWTTAKFDLTGTYESNGLTQYLNPEDTHCIAGQLCFYVLGNQAGLDLHRADKFHIKSIKFWSYDPDTFVAQPRLAAVFASKADAEEGLYVNAIYDSEAEGDVYVDLDSFIVPELPADMIPDGCEFLYFEDLETGDHYAPGDTYVFDKNIDCNLYAVYSVPTEVVFTVGEETFTENWMVGKATTLPAAPEAPAGLVFKGWKESTTDTVYKAGASYNFTDEEVSFEAVFVAPGTYYVSADGAIEGINETVYTSLDEADNAIAAESGVGTVYVEGDVTLTAMTFESSSVTVKGYDEAARAVLCSDSMVVASASGTELVFDDIIIKRADTSGDELWLCLRNVDLTFGEGCGYEKGVKTTNNSELNLYISQYSSSTVGYSITNNSEAVKFTIVTPDGNYGDGNINYTGDVDIEINAGYVGNAFLGTRNGKDASSPNKRIGDVTFTLNGGTVNAFNISHYPVKITGNATAIFNGGKVNTLIFGDQKSYTGASQSTISGTLTYVINAADMDAAPTVKAGAGHAATNSILVYNNTELADTAVESDVTADYLVLVSKGAATPVAGQNGKFTIVPDDTEFDQVLSNGVVLEADANGYYTLNEGTNYVSFGKEGFATYTLSYTDNGTETVIGAYYNGDTVVLPVLAPAAGYAHDGYVIDGVTYAPGAAFTMPESNVVAEVVWFENTENKWYVSKNGKNTNAGHKESAPLASIAKAFELIGTEDGTIVLMDMVTGFGSAPLAADQTVTITGEGYENAGFANGKHRLPVTQGHLILEHLIDYNHESNETNTPFRLQGNAELTIGTGYKLATLQNGVMTVTSTGTQVEMAGAANPVVNANGDMQFITFADWSSHTVSGDVTINIGPDAKFSCAEQKAAVSFGGDGGTVTSTVNGKIFVNVDGTQSETKIYRNGFKNTVTTVLNGFQVLLKNTTMTYAGDHASNGGYTNNGKEYIVTATTIDGTDVVTSAYGKVAITLIPETEAVITDANGTRTITESAEIELAEGETLIECVSNAKVTVTDNDTINITQNAGTLFTMPEGTAADGEVFLGWEVDGVLYAVGSQMKLPSTTCTVVLVPKTISKDAHVYIDQTNGNDENDGFSAETAVKTMAAAQKLLAIFPDEATLHVVGTLHADALATPAYDGVLNIVGTDTEGVLSAGYDVTFKSDVVLDDIGLKIAQDHKHWNLNGYSITFGAGAYKAEGSKNLMFHSGKQNADFTGDQVINVYSATAVDNIYFGNYYITGGTNKVWTGNITLNVYEGGKVSEFTGGDGYTTSTTNVKGTCTITGAVTVNVAEGAYVKNVGEGYCHTINGGFVIYNYGTTRIYHDSELTNYYCFNFYEGVTGTFADGVLTTNKAATFANTGADTDADNKINVVTGTYDVRAGKSLKDEGLTIEGAQIRLETADVDQALRFVADFTDALAAEYEGCEYGFVVLPKDALGNNMLTATGTYTYNETVYTPAIVKAERLYADKGDYVQYTAALTGLEPSQYKTEYVAATYIKSGDEYIYGDIYSVSVYKVAQAVLADETVTDETVKAEMQAIIDAADAQ